MTDDKKPREWEVSVPVPGKPFWSEDVVVVEKSEYLELKKERDELREMFTHERPDLCKIIDEYRDEVAELKRQLERANERSDDILKLLEKAEAELKAAREEIQNLKDRK